MASPTVTRASESEIVQHYVHLTGAGAATPTKNYGSSIALTRNGVGDLSFTWTHAPGVFLGVTIGKSANTTTDVDRFDFVADRDATTAKLVRGLLVSDAGAAADLPANCDLLLIFHFKGSKVKG